MVRKPDNHMKRRQASSLLPDELRRILPALDSAESDDNPRLYIRFFTRDSPCAWYVAEGSPQNDDFRFFGFLCWSNTAWAYFWLSELQAFRGPLGCPVERDVTFEGGRFLDVVPKHFQDFIHSEESRSE